MAGFPERLQKILGAKYRVENHGHGGTTASKPEHLPSCSSHGSYWKDKGLNATKAQDPAVAIIMFGSNDMSEWSFHAETFAADWKDLTSTYIYAGSKTKVVTMLPPANGNFSRDSFDVKKDPYGLAFCNRTAAPNGCHEPTDGRCVINCVLPHVLRDAASDLKLAAPLDLMTLMGGPDHTSDVLMTHGVHPECAGHTLIAETLAKDAFGVHV